MTRPGESADETGVISSINNGRRLRMAGAIVSLLPVAAGVSSGYFTARNMNNERIGCHQDQVCLVGKSSEAASDAVGIISGLIAAGGTAAFIAFTRYRGDHPIGGPYDPNY